MRITIKNFSKELENGFENYAKANPSFSKENLNDDLEKIKEEIFEKITTSMEKKSWKDTNELAGYYFEKMVDWICGISDLKTCFSLIEDQKELQSIIKNCFSFFTKMLSDFEQEFKRYIDVHAKSKMKSKRKIILFHRLVEHQLAEKESGVFSSKRHPIEPILDYDLKTYQNEIESDYLVWKEKKEEEGAVTDKLDFLDFELEECKQYIFDEKNEDGFISLITKDGEAIILMEEYYAKYVLPYFEKKMAFIFCKMDRLDEEISCSKKKNEEEILYFNLSKNELIANYLLMQKTGILSFKSDAHLARYLENNTRYDGMKRMKNVKSQISKMKNGSISISIPTDKFLNRINPKLKRTDV